MKENKKMTGDMRTMAIQLPEERFERLKAYLKKNNLKQKTAYEIYRCDWSSDVCSSDLKMNLKSTMKMFLLTAVVFTGHKASAQHTYCLLYTSRCV